MDTQTTFENKPLDAVTAKKAWAFIAASGVPKEQQQLAYDSIQWGYNLCNVTVDEFKDLTSQLTGKIRSLRGNGNKVKKAIAK